MQTHPYEDLRIWKEAHELALIIYRLTRLFPMDEQYCLVKQMRRSALSVPTNIVEGSGRYSTKDFIHFLVIAHGSAMECEYQCRIARELGYDKDDSVFATQQRFNRLGISIRACISGLRNKSQNEKRASSPPSRHPVTRNP